ncbi:hypothetical protein AMAG_02294 [Allomyces macrogynus ATCC 38327]|uniref:Uncharacterized protein n=1 Tax=Allomyces macrogynus (strain ATCC 38327) TaxID=578462 RepID=A0A0L0S2B7_ALLM3|nr:hypothetical protein AMAG_02294 [Allomyces macrogynus ATCC 38327]|eukprot:KNE56494.1 hypothetical protein AMAG_02294 [Allomyces macrogynus ATCC 38327]
MSTLASADRASPPPPGTRDAPRSRARTGQTSGPEPSLPEWSPLTATNVPSSSLSRRGRSESRASTTVVAAVTEIAGLPRTPAGTDRGRLPSRGGGGTSPRAKSVGRDAPASRESEYARHRAGTSVSNEFLKIRAREKIYDVNLVSKGMPRYEPLLDTYLQDHFNNPSVRKHLQNLGIIDEDGYIIDEREFQYIQLALDRQDKEAQVDLQNQQRDIDREVEVVLRAEGYPPCHKGKHHEHDFWSPLVEEYTRSLLPPIRSPRKVTPTGLASRYVKPGKRSTSTPPTAAASAGSDPFPLSPGRARGASATAVPITSIRASDIVYGDDFDSSEFFGGELVDLDELLAESATPVRAKSPPLRPIEPQRPSSQDQALQTSVPDLQSRTTSMPAVAEEEVAVRPAAACDASTTQEIAVTELDAIRHKLAGAKDLLKSGDDARARAEAGQAAATLSLALPTAGAALGAVSALLGEAHFIQARAMHQHGDPTGRDVALDAAFRHGADSPHLVRDLVLFKQHCEAADKSANRTQDTSILDSPEFTRTERMLLEYILSLGGNLAEAVQQVRANRAAVAASATAAETDQQPQPRRISRPTSAHATAAAAADAPVAHRTSRPTSASKTAETNAPSEPAAPRSSSRPASARSRRASASVKHSNAALAAGAAAAVAVGAGALAAAMAMGRHEREPHDVEHHAARNEPVPSHEDAKHDAAPAEPVAVEPAAADPVPKDSVDVVKPEPEVHEHPAEQPARVDNQPAPAQEPVAETSVRDAPNAVAPAQASLAATREDENAYAADFDDDAADAADPTEPADVALPKSVAASHALGLNDFASPAHVALPQSVAASHALGLNDTATAPPGPNADDHDAYADDDFEPAAAHDEMPYSSTAAAGIALPPSVAASQTLAKSQSLAASQTLAHDHPHVMNASFAAGFALPASVASSEQHLDSTTYPIDMAAVRLPPSIPSSITSSRYTSAASVHGHGSSFAAPWTVPLPESRSNLTSRAESAPIRPPATYDQVPLPPSRAASQALGGAGAGGAVGRRAESVAVLARRTQLPRSVTGSRASMGISRSVTGSRARLAETAEKKSERDPSKSKVPLPASVAGSRMLLKD